MVEHVLKLDSLTHKPHVLSYMTALYLQAYYVKGHKLTICHKLYITGLENSLGFSKNYTTTPHSSKTVV